ncbi:hypothetical protein R1sor_000220 [Riccia sorocarpa]|uniref:Cytochrome b561 domain-containing protein n=1 Tax=Riccia sorocarpa TaxID=122646 RepID=A0ABD3GSP9_9MARC
MARLTLLYVVILVLGLTVQRAAANNFDSDEEQKWVKVHGWLMWASMGFLLPLGILLVRMSKPMINADERPTSSRMWTCFYLHVGCQILAIAVATGGVGVLFVKTGVGLDFTHERLGLAVMCLVWCQPLIGLVRPNKGVPVRSLWFFIHWLFGNGALFLGVINIYIGIRVYEYLSTSSIRMLNIIFSIQIAVMCFWYLLQDRCSHMMSQGRKHKLLPQLSMNYSMNHSMNHMNL